MRQELSDLHESFFLCCFNPLRKLLVEHFFSLLLLCFQLLWRLVSILFLLLVRTLVHHLAVLLLHLLPSRAPRLRQHLLHLPLVFLLPHPLPRHVVLVQLDGCLGVSLHKEIVRLQLECLLQRRQAHVAGHSQDPHRLPVQLSHQRLVGLVLRLNHLGKEELPVRVRVLVLCLEDGHQVVVILHHRQSHHHLPHHLLAVHMVAAIVVLDVGLEHQRLEVSQKGFEERDADGDEKQDMLHLREGVECHLEHLVESLFLMRVLRMKEVEHQRVRVVDVLSVSHVCTPHPLDVIDPHRRLEVSN
mmetsp:Transcript_36537/g.113992  ORF Transcript_36537/g.113992 Transcript_36537/m.113992 type:complete len:301 (+) Transcript_36537:1670-2572(+)